VPPGSFVDGETVAAINASAITGIAISLPLT
jgi:hypothetical protein